MRIQVLLVQPPPQGAAFVQAESHFMDFRRLLGSDDITAYVFRAGGKVYHLWCDDLGVYKQLPPSGQLIGTKYPGWVMLGAFFITRIIGDEDCSVGEQDLPNILSFVTF